MTKLTYLIALFQFGGTKRETYLNLITIIINNYRSRYLTKNYTYWSKQGINGPKPRIFFGNFHEWLLNSPADIDIKRVNEYGKVYG